MFSVMNRILFLDSLAGMTRHLHITYLIGKGIAFILSFPTPDQIEGDTKDAIYHTAGDRLYPVIPDTSGIAFDLYDIIF